MNAAALAMFVLCGHLALVTHLRPAESSFQGLHKIVWGQSPRKSNNRL